MNLQDKIKQLLTRVEWLKNLSSEDLANSLDFKDIIDIHIHNLIDSSPLLARVFHERVNYYGLSDDKRHELINSIVEIEKYFDKRYNNTDIHKMEQFIKGGCDCSHGRAEEIKEFITKNLKDECYKQAVLKGNTDSLKRLLEDKHTLTFGTGFREFFEAALTYFSSLNLFFDYAHSLGYIQDKNLEFKNIKREYWDDIMPHSSLLKNVLIKIPVTLYVRQYKTVQTVQGNELTKDNSLEVLNATEIVLTEFENIIIAESKRLDSLPENETENQEESYSEKWGSLASQELTIAKLLLEGLTDCEIVNKKIPQVKNPSKFLNKNGVNSTVKRIFKKLEVNGRTELMAKYSKVKP